MATNSYYVDLQSDAVKLDDLKADQPIWLQALPLGKWKHPVYGVIDVTPERVHRFATNVKSRVRGIDLDIDYDHKEREGKAAGWVRDAEARKDGLWLSVAFTETALEALRKREYRYFSAEYADDWTDPATSTKYKDVLFGGALTNRPFIKDILPINLSEVVKDRVGESQEGAHMGKVAKELGLPDDATEDQILGAMQAKLAEQTKEPPKTEEPPKPPVEDDKRTLAENDPIVRTLQQEIDTLKAANKLSETNRVLGEIATSSKRTFPPAVLDKARTLAVKLSSNAAEEVFALLKEIQEKGLVELGERGGKPDPTEESGKDPATVLSERVNKLMEGDKTLSYVDATNKVFEEDPNLYSTYRRASYIDEEDGK